MTCWVGSGKGIELSRKLPRFTDMTGKVRQEAKASDRQQGREAKRQQNRNMAARI